ncbi:gamma-glutamyl kinase [Yoonia sp. 208BN28-4]|uniref:gamma-glutamyl kinase n=1 Tax=Yoonia sp. 208BN28-4 TaxID=3126505 RepID=UPI0030AC9BE3
MMKQWWLMKRLWRRYALKLGRNGVQMLVFWKEKLVFLAVPKTGTTAIEGALAPRASIVMRDPPVLKHSPVYRYNRYVEPFLTEAGGAEAMETVAVVRHPVDWLSSWFRYRNRNELVGEPNSTRDVSFNEFVLEYCREKPASFANVGAQSKFLLRRRDQKLGVDHLFSYERPQSLYDFFEERLQTKVETKRVNVSPDFKVHISEEVESHYREVHALEFSLWEMAKT